MKKISAVILALAIIFTLSACEEKPNESAETVETTAVTEETVPAETTTVTEPPVKISSETEKKINSIIAYIIDSKIEKGYFYDFNKDGFPELVEYDWISEIRNDGFIDYFIYDFKNGEPVYIGAISRCEAAYGEKLTLYRNKKNGQYMYIGNELYELSDTKKANSTRCYLLSGSVLGVEEIAHYSYTEDSSDGKINVYENRFLDKIFPPMGVQKLADMNKLIGLEDYISENYEKIEEIKLPFVWTSLDEAEQKVRAFLTPVLESYEEKPETSYTPPEELKALFQNEDFRQEISDNSTNYLYHLTIYENDGERYLIIDYGHWEWSEKCSVYNISTGEKLGEYDGYAFNLYDDNGAVRCISFGHGQESGIGKELYSEIILTENKIEVRPLAAMEYMRYADKFPEYTYTVSEKEATEDEYRAAEERIKNLSQLGMRRIFFNGANNHLSEKNMGEMIIAIL